jgi:hypothetical protein
MNPKIINSHYFFLQRNANDYFDIIDSVKLIMAKIDFNLKWFMFRYIDAKVN